MNTQHYYIKYGATSFSLVKRIVTDLVGNVTDVELTANGNDALSFDKHADATFEANWLVKYGHPATVWNLR